MATDNNPAPKACDACKARTLSWLVEHFEAWHGPKDTWNKRTKDRFYQDLSLLNLFAEDFHFPDTKTE